MLRPVFAALSRQPYPLEGKPSRRRCISNIQIRYLLYRFASFLLNSPLDLRNLPEPVLCGVSSFGFSGTNAHVVIEEFVSTVTTRESVGESADRPLYLLTVSSLSAEGLIQQKERYERYLQTHPGESIADICYTANQRRRHFAYRLAVCGSTAGELLTRMQSWHPDKAQHSDGVFYGKAVNRTSAPVDVMEIPFEPVLENAETLYALCRRYVQDLSFDAATFGRFFPRAGSTGRFPTRLCFPAHTLLARFTRKEKVKLASYKVLLLD